MTWQKLSIVNDDGNDKDPEAVAAENLVAITQSKLTVMEPKLWEEAGGKEALKSDTT